MKVLVRAPAIRSTLYEILQGWDACPMYGYVTGNTYTQAQTHPPKRTVGC